MNPIRVYDDSTPGADAAGAPLPPAPTLAERIEGALLGLLVGDALGVPYEFKPSPQIPPPAGIEFDPPPGYPRSHPHVPPGTWSDDGAQALVLLDSLLHCSGLDLDHFAQRLVQWRDQGLFAVDGQVFDVGCQTSTALARLREGIAPERAGPDGERDQGNGSLMRVLPLALWHRGGDTALAALAARQSLPTHGHPVCLAACAMLCLWGRRLMSGQPAAEAWRDAAATLHRVAADAGLQPGAVAALLDPGNAERISGSGYVVDTLWSARHCLGDGHDYESAVKLAIAMGNDTDTTAAVTGGLAGMRHGVAAIPRRWRDGLRGTGEWQGLARKIGGASQSV